jgi:DNA end-binding protein Ku
VVSMLKAKQAGQTFTVPEPSQPANVVNIMDALKKSLEAAGGDGALRRPRAPSKKAEAPAAKEKETARKPAPKKPVARKAARG